MTELRSISDSFIRFCYVVDHNPAKGGYVELNYWIRMEKSFYSDESVLKTEKALIYGTKFL